MNTTDQNIEAEIRAKGANVAPRVKPEDIEAQIDSEHYFTAAEGIAGYCFRNIKAVHSPSSLNLVTICVLITKNGTKLVGANEGPVSPENFNPELGRKYARQKAIDQLWPMLGYELRSKLAQAAPLTLPVIDQATLNPKEN